jgi:hypothetical protein
VGPDSVGTKAKTKAATKSPNHKREEEKQKHLTQSRKVIGGSRLRRDESKNKSCHKINKSQKRRRKAKTAHAKPQSNWWVPTPSGRKQKQKLPQNHHPSSRSSLKYRDSLAQDKYLLIYSTTHRLNDSIGEPPVRGVMNYFMLFNFTISPPRRGDLFVENVFRFLWEPHRGDLFVVEQILHKSYNLAIL